MKKRFILFALSATIIVCSYACIKFDFEGSPCKEHTTAVEILARDYYTRQAIAGLDFTLYENNPYCVYLCWDDSVGHIKTNQNGKAGLRFRHDSLDWKLYYLGIFNQKRYFQVDRMDIEAGCPNFFDVLVKPANTVSLQLSRSARSGLGKTRICFWRKTMLPYHTSIDEREWPGHLFSVWLDSIPPNFAQTVSFPAATDEMVVYWAENKTNKRFMVDSFYNARRDTFFHRIVL